MTELRGFKFVTTLVVEFKKIESDGASKDDPYYSHSKVKTFINESDIDNVFKSVYGTIMSNITWKGFRLGY